MALCSVIDGNPGLSAFEQILVEKSRHSDISIYCSVGLENILLLVVVMVLILVTICDKRARLQFS